MAFGGEIVVIPLTADMMAPKGAVIELRKVGE